MIACRVVICHAHYGSSEAKASQALLNECVGCKLSLREWAPLFHLPLKTSQSLGAPIRGGEADGDAERRVKDPSPKDVNGNECNFRRKLCLPPFASLPPAVASARMPNLYLCMDVYIIE